MDSDAVLDQHGARSAAEAHAPQRNSHLKLAVADGNSCRRTIWSQHASKSLGVIPAGSRMWQMMFSQASLDLLGQQTTSVDISSESLRVSWSFVRGGSDSKLHIGLSSMKNTYPLPTSPCVQSCLWGTYFAAACNLSEKNLDLQDHCSSKASCQSPRLSASNICSWTQAALGCIFSKRAFTDDVGKILRRS